jgi:hypothetical protein
MNVILGTFFRPSRRGLVLVLAAFLPIAGPAQRLRPGLKSSGASQSGKRSAAEKVFAELLEFPAPPPAAADVSDEEAADKRPPGFYDPKTPPPDKSSTADLVAYWIRYREPYERDRIPVTPLVRERLLTACEADPILLAGLVSSLPQTPETAARVLKLYTAAPNNDDFDDSWHEKVRDWLRYNSTHYLNELIDLAGKATDARGEVANARALTALARVDRDRALPLVQAALNGNQPRLATLAATIEYRWALADRDAAAEALYRARLVATAEDEHAPGWSRNEAVNVLLDTEWPGRDYWYLAKFSDPSLASLHDPPYGFSPLATFFDRDPDRWLPVMTRLIESPDETLRRNAGLVMALLMKTKTTRKDAILPLLRWLSEPNWLAIGDLYRLRLIQKLERVQVPEGVPGLIWVVRNDSHNRKWAAESLAHYRDPEAAAVLKEALNQPHKDEETVSLVQGLIGTGGVPENEQIAAMESYAWLRFPARPLKQVARTASGVHESPSLALVIGEQLARRDAVDEGVVHGVIARAEQLQSTDPKLSMAMLEVAQRWNSRLIDKDLLRRIGKGAASSGLIEQGLQRREKLVQNVPVELRALAATPGFPSGVAAVMLDDNALVQKILESDDDEALIGLLACARLTPTPLPVGQVGPLLKSRSELLALAAQKYLLAEDSPEARRILTDHFSQQAFITGWRENDWQLFEDPAPPLDEVEEGLRQELFKPGNAPHEIFAALDNADRATHIVRVYRDRAVYSWYEEGTGYRSRTLTAAALEQFRSSLAASKLPDSGPVFDYCHHDCTGAEFLALTRASGRRVFSYQSRGAWEGTLAKFTTLAAR